MTSAKSAIRNRPSGVEDLPAPGGSTVTVWKPASLGSSGRHISRGAPIPWISSSGGPSPRTR